MCECSGGINGSRGVKDRENILPKLKNGGGVVRNDRVWWTFKVYVGKIEGCAGP